MMPKIVNSIEFSKVELLFSNKFTTFVLRKL